MWFFTARDPVEQLIRDSKDKDVAVRSGAIRALGSCGDPRALGPLSEALNDTNPDIRWCAAKALEILGWKPSGVEQKVGYFLALGKWDELVEIGSPAVEPLIEALKSEDSDTRRNASKALGELKDPSAVGPLIASLRDARSYVRRNAVKALGVLGDTRSVQPIIKLLNDPDAGVRVDAVVALGALKDLKAVEPLCEVLSDEDSDVRINAIEVLGEMGDRRAMEPLTNCLRDWRLGPIATGALFKLGWAPQTDADRTHVMIAKRQRTGLVESWNVTQKVLLDDVSSRDYRHIENALYAFIGIGKGEIIPVLIEKLDRHGNKIMAEAYLNCGHPELRSAAEAWARRNGYVINSGSGSHPVSWGRM